MLKLSTIQTQFASILILLALGIGVGVVITVSAKAQKASSVVEKHIETTANGWKLDGTIDGIDIYKKITQTETCYMGRVKNTISNVSISCYPNK